MKKQLDSEGRRATRRATKGKEKAKRSKKEIKKIRTYLKRL